MFTYQDRVSANISRYLDYWNDFLTIGRFAEYYEYSEKEANKVIKKGRVLHHDQFGTESLPSHLAVVHH